MSQLIFSHAKSIRNKQKKAIAYYIKTCEETNTEPEFVDKLKGNILINEIEEFKEILEISKQLHEVYTNVLNMDTNNWYFVTIRPDEKKIILEDFRRKVISYLDRKCMKAYYLSFEQKGTSIETLGSGFHAHILIKSTWRSKGECLRDTLSTFNKMCANNCIEIKTTREPEKIRDNYLLDYKSEDGHKEITKEWDTIWRNENKIDPLYTLENSSVSSSPVETEQRTIIHNKTLVKFN